MAVSVSVEAVPGRVLLWPWRHSREIDATWGAHSQPRARYGEYIFIGSPPSIDELSG